MDIKFDKMTLETGLVQEYINTNEGLSELYEDYSGTVKKKQSNIKWNFKTSKELSNTSILHKAQNLGSLLQKNITLITELEYHIRKIPIEDTKAQVDIIIKKLKCYSPLQCVHTWFDGVTKFLSHDQLLHFGILLDMLLYSTSNIELVIFSKAAAVICHLLVKLCNEAGFQSIQLVYCDGKEIRTEHELEIERGLYSGTVAVVSEDADVDSAVDAFLSASAQSPWSLRRILVQESIYQQFKDAIRWKCNLIKPEGEPQASHGSCSETLTNNGKVFLIDPVEVTEYQKSIVIVEAYRTRKEMISLVQKYKTRYLSLWANGIAEINEVVFNTTSSLVWVNNIADFRGPPQISKALYSDVCNLMSQTIEKCDKISKLGEFTNPWMKKTFERRLDILCKALDKCTVSDPKNEVYANIKKTLLDYSPESFVDVGKDYVCIGMSQPLGIIGIEGNQDFFTFEFFKSLLYGNAYVVARELLNNKPDSKLIDLIGEEGVPVILVDGAASDFTTLDWRYPYSHRTKVVWTNSGTIFAN